MKGRVGLFPDNFVELIGTKTNSEDQEQKHETSQVNCKSNTKVSHSTKRNEKANVRKSLDTKNARPGILPL